MINCPNCGGLNQEGSLVCGNCGASLVNNEMQNTEDIIQNNLDNLYNPKPNENPQPMNEVIISDNVKTSSVDKADIIVFVLALLSWFFIRIYIIKLVLAVVFFVLAEKSENKRTVFPILTRIVCLLQIIAFILIYIPFLINYFKHL